MERFIIGKHPVMEALKTQSNIEKLLILFGMKGKEIEKMKKLARKKNVSISEVNKLRFRELVGDATTQGILAVCTDRDYASVEDILKIAEERKEKPFILITDELADPHNLGALSRTAEAVGVHGIVIPKHHSTGVNHTTSKVSAGASELLAYAKVTNIANTLEELKSKGLWIVGSDMEAPKNYTDIDYDMPLALVIGNEKKGMKKNVREKCDFVIRIPMFGKINSLNASVAGGIILYEAARKRRKF
jgi:23S rRNA (guanosine2251-2'-O)-methyltransferase